MTMSYVELHASSAFSFLRGGSFPEQLAETAAEMGMLAMALLDRNGVYGAQRFSVAAREHKVRPIVGCELLIDDGSVLPVLVENRTGYKNLCELLTQAHLRSEKGKCAVQWNELSQFAKGLVALFGIGEHRLPACNVRQLAGRSFSICTAFRSMFAAGCRKLPRRLSGCSPERRRSRSISNRHVWSRKCFRRNSAAFHSG
jgi:DNA polymerase III, alpha subunit